MDIEAQLVQAVAEVASAGGRICVTGDGSKRDWFPHDAASQMLTTKEHTGIVAYEPSELVITARCGTPLVDVVRELDRHDQMLACDPPRFYGDGTIGGAVSSGLSGPARPWRGRLRDAVLGLQLINGFAQVLNFGGQVMKNVAGYDVSRLVAGAGGALGIATQVSLRVQPAPENEITLVFSCDATEGLALCRDWAGRYLPLSATAWRDGTLRVRLSGTESAISMAHAEIGGDIDPSEPVSFDIKRDEKGELQNISVTFESTNRPDGEIYLDMDVVNELADFYEELHGIKAGEE